jgi:zinc-ribbon domain
MAFCTRCGAQIQQGSGFCSRCGQSIGAAPPAPPQYRPAAPPAQYYQPPAVPGAPQQSGRGINLNLPPAIAGIFTPLGLMPFIATILCWLCWFELPGVTISALGAMQAPLTLWGALAFGKTESGTMEIGGDASHGILSVLVIICLLAPFAVPFIRHRLARFIYAAPLFGFIVGGLAIAYALNEFNSIAGQNGGSVASPIQTSFGFGAYLAGLLSIVAAAGVVTSVRSGPAGFAPPPVARVAAPPAAPLAQPPVAYAPPPPAYVAPPYVAPPHAASPAAHHAPAQAAGFCTSCGTARVPGMRFCTRCGAQLPPPASS